MSTAESRDKLLWALKCSISKIKSQPSSMKMFEHYLLPGGSFELFIRRLEIIVIAVFPFISWTICSKHRKCSSNAVKNLQRFLFFSSKLVCKNTNFFLFVRTSCWRVFRCWWNFWKVSRWENQWHPHWTNSFLEESKLSKNSYLFGKCLLCSMK